MADATEAGEVVEKSGVAATIDTAWEKVKTLAEATNIPQQIDKVDVAGLFSNPWFIVPFGILVVYQLYKQAFRDLIIEAIVVAVWWVSGTQYMNSLIVGGELQVSKVLPVLFGGALVTGFVIYLLFGRSD